MDNEIFKSKHYALILSSLEKTIHNFHAFLDCKPDFMDAKIEEELRDVIMKYAEISKDMI